MKCPIKKFAFFSIVVTVLLSAVFCCCLNSVTQVKANTSLASCHQTHEAHETEAPHSAEDCECDQTFAVIDNDLLKTSYIQTLSLAYSDNHTASKEYSSIFARAYHAPPVFYDAIPLYLKYSILRI